MTPPWIAPDTVLSGRHVRLVPLDETHTPALFRAGSDAEVWRFVPFKVSTEADMAQYVRTALADRERGEAFPFVILAANSRRVLGSTRFYALAPAHRNLEIGYTWLDPQVWRTAVNSECKLMMMAHAFETLDCLRVALRTDAANVRSRRAMERFGAVQEGVFRKHMIMPDGRLRDSVYYSVIDEEWPKVRAFLRVSLGLA